MAQMATESDLSKLSITSKRRSERRGSVRDQEGFNETPQTAPGAFAAKGHEISNSIPLSIFPVSADKFCFCFVGLPGRGKTHVARRLARYLEFFHAFPTGVFNVSEYRRRICGVMRDSTWHDNGNQKARELRARCNEEARNDLVKFLGSHTNAVGILDSTNPTRERRALLRDAVVRTGAKLMFIEVQNVDEKFLTTQYRTFASTSPDYQGVDQAEAESDYRNRVAAYVKVFETLDDSDPVERNYSFFKCDHSRRHFVTHKIGGYIFLKVVNFIMNLRTTAHSFFISRHGQSEYNAQGRIGGDSGLSHHGVAYARQLAKFCKDTIAAPDAVSGSPRPARLWTSTMRRTQETAQFIETPTLTLLDEDDSTISYEWVNLRKRPWHHLDELYAGECDGLTYEEIEREFPREFEMRAKDKVAYRYPRGESYLDVIARVEPMIIEMERHREPLLIIGHQAVLRIVIAFYEGKSRAEAPHISIPLNTVIQLDPSVFKCEVTRHVLYEPPAEVSLDGQDEPQAPDFNVNDPPSH